MDLDLAYQSHPAIPELEAWKDLALALEDLISLMGKAERGELVDPTIVMRVPAARLRLRELGIDPATGERLPPTPAPEGSKP
jgi:hypothetical protein